jgi:hypothetical protein
MIYTRTTQQWQWFLGKLWYAHYRYPYDQSDLNPYITAIDLIQSKLHVGNPVDHEIAVAISPDLIEEWDQSYVDHLRNSGLLGRQPQHGHVPELLGNVPGTDHVSNRRPAPLSEVRPEPESAIRARDI